MSSNNALLRAIEIAKWPIEISGSTNSTFLAWLLSQNNFNQPILLVCASEKKARQCSHDIEALMCAGAPPILLPFDESPYSGLYPSPNSIRERAAFLWRARHCSSKDIFISSIEGLLQKTMPSETFSSYEITLRKGDEVDVSTLCTQLIECGYSSVPLVEDSGTFSKRGDILDIFSPTFEKPLRIEFFGDTIESIRLFDAETQLSEKELTSAPISPAREIILTNETRNKAVSFIKSFCDEGGVTKETRDNLIEPLTQNIFSHGIEYWLPAFFEKPENSWNYFKIKPLIVWLDLLDIERAADGFRSQYRDKHRELLKKGGPTLPPESIFTPLDSILSEASNQIHINAIHIEDSAVSDKQHLSYKVFDTSDINTLVRAAREAKKDFFPIAAEKIREFQKDGMSCVVWAGTQTQAQRLSYLFETQEFIPELLSQDAPLTLSSLSKNEGGVNKICIVPRYITSSMRFPDDGVVFLRDEDFFGNKTHRETRKSKGTLEQRAKLLSFGDLNPGDLVVHTLHGIGSYEGLKKIELLGVENEFIQLSYKDNDKLYLPVYRVSQIQKYTGPSGAAPIDKLGTTSWQKAKVKVKSALRDLADELMSLYAKRASTPGFAFSEPDTDFREFEGSFPYDETPDQAKAIDDVIEDMTKDKPMDRLVCGDVGFGKTEVAIRAAYKAVQDKKQVAVLVPTTILAYQHLQTFKKRFDKTAVSVGMISRFSSSAQIKKDLTLLKEGKLDIIIGTHRLLSKDVSFNDLGLLVVDEEQKFGVAHKERIKKFKTQVDVLTLSATPIPRTLNMGLMGIRDLSIINTPPEDRLSIRTFISRFDEETIRKAILSEVSRGGQIYFIHNRVQSIHGFADEIKRIVPEVKIRIGHGQMGDEELEKTMLDFFNHEFDVLICTTIIESGLDIPTANTIIVDRADTFGLSQLYQLRGRVGRSKERAYAYLLIPPSGSLDKTAQERLKILQEYTELGSGFHIAHHDLELRGGGNILGENQSGHIATVGYELYMELLDQALNEARGNDVTEDIEPDINLRIPAMIPDKYIEDIRLRLGYYKALGEVQDESDLDKIETEMVDRFGQLPEQVTNLFGIMLIRRYCKDLGVRDISSGPKNLSLAFTTGTKASPQALILLATKQAQKYQMTPDQRLIIRLNSMGWPAILEELKYLKKSLF